MSSSDSKLDGILARVQAGTLSPEQAKAELRAYEDLGFARIDTNRAERKGFPEVVFAEGKSVDQVIGIIDRLRETGDRVLATRVPVETAEAVLARWPDIQHNPTGRTLSWVRPGTPSRRFDGYVAVVSGGTTDMPVAEEAAETATALGAEVHRIYDVGVAGIHRLFANLEEIRQATAVVVAAGMEGALSSVVAGLVACPVIGVPTSVGYGANFEGLAALLTMLNSCAPGITVVNIDNGFGAGYYAGVISRQVTTARTGESLGGTQ